MSEDQKALSVTIKGPNANDPWVVVYAKDARDAAYQLEQVQEEGVLAAAANVSKEYHALLGAQKTLDGTFASRQQQGGQAGPTAPSAPANSGGPRTEQDKWGNDYTFNRPDAPTGYYGTAVHKRWKASSGKWLERWVDPRGKGVPGNYEAGVRSDPDDLWDGDWVNKR
jgi:hypothetical protein